MTASRIEGPDGLLQTSERIVLRRLGAFDLEDFQSYRRDPEVARFQSWQSESDSEARSFLTGMGATELLRPGHWCQIGIADRSTNALIGDIGICVAADRGEAEIGFSVARHAQGKGLAGEAVREAILFVFDHSDVKKIIGITDARNLPSIRLLERVGMQMCRELETTFRGEPCTEFVFIILRKEAIRSD